MRSHGTGSDPAHAAALHLAERLGSFRPRLALVLGSGLGGFVGRLADAVRVPCEDIPGWPRPGVEGHAGLLVAGEVAGLPVLALSGRVHLYEGVTPRQTTLPVRVAAGLGAEILFVTNAAGSLRGRWCPGDLMLIADQMNLCGVNPLVGPTPEGAARRPVMADCYDPALRAAVREAARSAGIPLREGVYAGTLGPSYETPAEVAMLSRFGADAVGMSTVQEVLEARALGLRCVGVSCITNHAAGISSAPLRHEEVLEAGRRAGERFETLIVTSLRSLAGGGSEEPGPPGRGARARPSKP